MNRNISLVIVLSIILSLLSFNIASASDTTSMNPTVELTYTNSNNICTVTAKLKGITTTLVGISLVLNYDSNVLSYTKSNNLVPTAINQLSTTNKTSTVKDSSTLTFGWNANNEAISITPTAGEIPLCTTTFNILNNANTVISINSESSIVFVTPGVELPTFTPIAISQISIPVTYTAPTPPAGGGTGGGGGGGGGTTPVVPIITPAPTPANTFTDLSGYDWASESIYKLSKLGIIKGTSETTFSPANNITRADFAVLLSRTFNLKNEVTDNFNDVPADEYFYEPIGILKSLGIAQGSEGNYRPYEPITRQDIIVLTHRALSLLGNITDSPDYDILNKFSDKSDVADYAVASVCVMIGRGIIKGNNGQLSPYDYAIRAEAAVIFDRIYDILPK